QPEALEGEPEGGGGGGAYIPYLLADHPRQRDVDLLHLAGGRDDEVLTGGADGAHGAQVLERVDRFGAGGLEEELRDVGATLGERADSVGEIATVGVGLASERNLEVCVRAARRHARIVLGGRALCPDRLPC